MFREASWVVIAGNKRSFVGCKSVFPGGFAGSLVNFGGVSIFRLNVCVVHHIGHKTFPIEWTVVTLRSDAVAASFRWVRFLKDLLVMFFDNFSHIF